MHCTAVIFYNFSQTALCRRSWYFPFTNKNPQFRKTKSISQSVIISLYHKFLDFWSSVLSIRVKIFFSLPGILGKGCLDCPHVIATMNYKDELCIDNPLGLFKRQRAILSFYFAVHLWPREEWFTTRAPTASLWNLYPWDAMTFGFMFFGLCFPPTCRVMKLDSCFLQVRWRCR